MDFIAYLLLLGLMGTVCSSSDCPKHCEITKNPTHYMYFQHSTELQSTSVAPWDLVYNVTEGREPSVIQYARCKNCTVEHMIAKPIYIKISVYQRIRNTTRGYCKCPLNVAVGCTCVDKRQ